MFLPELEQARVRLHVGPRDCGEVRAGLSVERLEPTELIALLCEFGGKLAHAGAFIGHEMDFTSVWLRRVKSRGVAKGRCGQSSLPDFRCRRFLSAALRSAPCPANNNRRSAAEV